jgi:hypothetical protein
MLNERIIVIIKVVFSISIHVVLYCPKQRRSHVMAIEGSGPLAP